MSPGKDNRRWPRIPKRMPVDVVVIDPSQAGGLFKLDAVWTKDVGGNGLGLVTGAHCMVGAQMKLKFIIPNYSRPVEVRGTVVWSQLDNSSLDYQYRIGVAFDKVDPADHEALMQYVESEAKRSTQASSKS